MNDSRWESVSQSVQALASTLELDKILANLMDELLSVIPAADAFVLFMYDEKKKKLIPERSQGFEIDALEQLHLDPGEGMSGKTYLERQAKIFPKRTDVSNAMDNLSSKNKEFFTKAIRSKQPLSAMSAPLIIKSKCLGVITIDNYSGVHFNQEDLEILRAIATHASIAIENSQLYEEQRKHLQRLESLHLELEDKNQKLNKAMAIYNKFLHISLKGEGIVSLCNGLSKSIEKDVTLFDDFSQVLAGKGIHHIKSKQEILSILHHVGTGRKESFFEIENENYYAKPITSNNALLGILLLHSSEEGSSEFMNMAIDIGCTVFALELMKEQSNREKRYKIMGDMLDELLNGRSDSLLLDRLKMTTSGKMKSFYSMFAIIIDHFNLSNFEWIISEKNKLFRIIQKVLHSMIPDAIILEKNESFYILISTSNQSFESSVLLYVDKIIQLIRDEILKWGLHITISTAKGRVIKNPINIKESYQDTKMCLDFIQTANLFNHDMDYKQMGINRLLYKNDVSELERYMSDVLGPIVVYDQLNNSDFINTLIQYLSSGRNVQQTSKELSIHVNTLYYRLKKIEEILGVTKEGKLDWLQVELALQVYRYLQDLKVETL